MTSTECVNKHHSTVTNGNGATQGVFEGLTLSAFLIFQGGKRLPEIVR